MSLTSTKWQTMAVVGYREPVARIQEPRAHGGVCLLQVRQGLEGLQGRKVNSNGRYLEASDPFDLDAKTLANWEAIAKEAK